MCPPALRVYSSSLMMVTGHSDGRKQLMGSLFRSRGNGARIREASRNRFLRTFREGRPLGGIQADDVTRDVVTRIETAWRFGGRPLERKIVPMLRGARPLKQ